MEYQEGHIIDGRYSLEQFIGSGSFGEVWVAKDIQTEMEVAIKIYISMDKHGLEEFKKEFQVSFDLNQTNLLHSNYLGVDSRDSRAYLIMPYCPEGSISSRIGQLTESELWKFIYDVASGLAYLHGQNPPIIHQDIKPDNILISRTGDYLITDFGISRQVRNTLRRSARSANVAGAPAYMGPERYSSNPMPIKASDIWSLGATIYELATGDLPFCGMGGVMQKNGADMTALPDHFSDEFKSIVYKCLALETWDRPAAKDIAEEARAQLRNLDVLGKTVPIDRGQAEIDSSDEAKKDTPNEEVTVEESRKTQVMAADEIRNHVESNALKSTVKADQTHHVAPETVSENKNAPSDTGKIYTTLVWVLSVAGLCCGFLINLFF